MNKESKAMFKKKIYAYSYQYKDPNALAQRIADDIEIYVKDLCVKIQNLEKKLKEVEG